MGIIQPKDCEERATLGQRRQKQILPWKGFIELSSRLFVGLVSFVYSPSFDLSPTPFKLSLLREPLRLMPPVSILRQQIIRRHRSPRSRRIELTIR